MKKHFLSFLLLFSVCYAFAQDDMEKRRAVVVAEGRTLYNSEMASWYGTDLFLEKYTDRSNIGGYFSYSDKDVHKCIFFSKDEEPKVLGTISFDNTFDTGKANLNLKERKFSRQEQQLYIIRTKTLAIIRTDTFFKQYEDTNLNLIPIISNGEKKVYVLTGPVKSGVVVFGNDYLLTFDDQNNLTAKKSLHANIIITEYGNEKDGKKVIAPMHSHLPSTGDIITATDICTTMLYEKFAGWLNNYIISEKYVSIWNCKTDELTVITTEAWKSIRDSKSAPKEEKK